MPIEGRVQFAGVYASLINHCAAEKRCVISISIRQGKGKEGEKGGAGGKPGGRHGGASVTADVLGHTSSERRGGRRSGPPNLLEGVGSGVGMGTNSPSGVKTPSETSAWTCPLKLAP